MLIKFQRRDSLVQLPRVGIVVRGDIQLFVFAGALAQFERPLAILLRHFTLAKVVVDRAQSRVSHSEIGIQFHRTLIQR